MSEYISHNVSRIMPRIPLEGEIDLTYRCNNDCRHCWLRIAPGAEEKKRELTFEEIKDVVDSARAMGCREWSISGGEPMLRPDFPEIFEYIAKNSRTYALNTNGILITPEIARLMRRKGDKMVALYGATKDIYEHITRIPGSFEKMMQGIAYLKEAGAGFTLQIIPMRDNYHQFEAMVKLAESLSPSIRVGATYLYLSADGDPLKNAEIKRQRLKPVDVIALNSPSLTVEGLSDSDVYRNSSRIFENDCIYDYCIQNKRDFHIDPYGGMSFCCFVKDPELRYDLRKGTFREAWEEFIPGLAGKIHGGDEFRQNCGNCEYWGDCKWCGVYAYLEHQRHSAKIEYFCGMAKEARQYRERYREQNSRYYNIAGLTVLVNSDLPLKDNTFDPKFEKFRVHNSGEDIVSFRYRFMLPDLKDKELGEPIYRKVPLEIYKKGDSYIYKTIVDSEKEPDFYQIYVFNRNHTRGIIYSKNDSFYQKGGLKSLSMFTTDQIPLARVLADRNACYIHSGGVILDGKGLLFVGHSTAGKSTTMKLLKEHAEILCDDRNIVRFWDDGFKIHGTWSHGEIPQVSASSAPLKAILFLEKSFENKILPMEDRLIAVKTLLGCLVKPLLTQDWWEKMLSLVDIMTLEVPCYRMLFNRKNDLIEKLRAL